MHKLSLRVATETWPIAGTFTISRGSKTKAHVVVVELNDGRHCGRGESVPYPRYAETITQVMAQIHEIAGELESGVSRAGLQQIMPAGAARNAVDCALWDLDAKARAVPVHQLAGLKVPPRPLITALTISLNSPETMAAAAAQARARRLLKVKLGGDGDRDRIRAVRRAAPEAELIVDANEAWHAGNLADNLAACAEAGVTLVEQPLPAGADDALGKIARPIPVCADESVHDRASLATLVGKYDAVNVKLDKTGGLTEALALTAEAERLGFAIMVGCMVCTSLSIAPAMLVAQRARVVDLDGPLLLAHDRPYGLRYEESLVYPATPDLWG
jgi:L-Ala-D/L-Glu epimerase / N-acetyl-D-glutamate racemase